MTTFPSRTVPAAALVFAGLTAALVVPGPAGDARDAKPAADTRAFDKSVKPFLAAHCAKCHGADKPKGDLTLTDVSGDIAGGIDLSRWTAVAERLKAGDMPPEGEKRLGTRWKPPHANTTAYEVFIELPYVDGRFLMRNRAGQVVCYDLRKK